MKRFNKIIASLTLATTLGSSFGALSAREMSPYNSHQYGYAYEGARSVSTLSPAIVIGSVAAVAAIVVFATNDSGNRSKGHSHSHSHSH